jgi:hypothetical protein
MTGYYAGDNFCRKRRQYHTMRIRKTGQAKALHMLNRLKSFQNTMDHQDLLTIIFKNHCYLFVTHFTSIKVQVTLSVNNVRFH